MLGQLEKERKARWNREIQDALEAARLRAEIRQRNEQRVKDEQGVQETLEQFHKPVIAQMEKQEERRQEHMRKIHESIEDFTIPPPLESSRHLEVEGVPKMFQEGRVLTINLNKDLDESFIKSLGFQLPSELVNKSDEELEKIINLANDQNKHMGSKKGPIQRILNSTNDEQKKVKSQELIDAFDSKISMVKRYIRALKALKEGGHYSGEGIDPLDYLYKLTEKLCKGSRSAKLHNRIVVLLDQLHKRGRMNSEDVKRYYETFLSA